MKWDYHAGIHAGGLESKEDQCRRLMSLCERTEENLKLSYGKGKEKKGTYLSVRAYSQLITTDTAYSYQWFLGGGERKRKKKKKQQTKTVKLVIS